ncbi:hypothetical protein ABTH88_23430, partial [Acinetobacter baumannii]
MAAPAAAAPVAAARVDGSARVRKNGELDWPALYQAVVPGAAAAPVAEGSAEAAPVAAAAA